MSSAVRIPAPPIRCDSEFARTMMKRAQAWRTTASVDSCARRSCTEEVRRFAWWVPSGSSLAAAVLGVLLAAGVVGCPREDGSEGVVAPSTPSVAVTGGSAPDFSGRDIDGAEVRLSRHFGKEVVLLDFCSTWCEPCVAEFPHLRRLYEANKSKGLLVLAISVDGPETVANVPVFARRNQLSFPVMVDYTSRIASLYNPKRTAPLSVLIDRAGKILAIHEGYTPGDEETLFAEVAKALNDPTVPSR